MPNKDGEEARADSAFYALMFLLAGVVMGGAVFLQVSGNQGCTELRKGMGPRLRQLKITQPRGRFSL